MKKIIVVLMVLVTAAPLLAASTVEISSTKEGDVWTITYEVTAGTERVRAFALDLTVDSGTITAVTAIDPNYWVYPGSIDINDTTGQIDSYGQADANANDYPGVTLSGPNGVTIEAGSLYLEGDDANKPGMSGVLCKLTATGTGGLCIAENVARGGIVM